MSRTNPPVRNSSTLRHFGAAGRSTASALIFSLALLAGCGGDVDSRMQEVRALQDVGQFTQSIEELRKILAISPDFPEANYRLGAALVQTGDPTRAIWALQKASESPDFAVPAGLLLATTHFSVRDLEEAIRAANRVLENEPDRLAALKIRARSNLGIHNLDEALADCERLIELQPDDYSSYATYASVLWDMGRADEAEAAHDAVREMGEASDDPALRPRACQAPALFAKDFKKDMVKAEALYLECLDTYPTSPYLINQVTTFLDGIGKREDATVIIRESVEREPENLSLRSTLAERLRRAGDGDGAEAVLVEATETFGSAAAWNLLAKYYRRTGEPEKSLAAVDKVIELTGGGGEGLRFMQADILVDLEQYDRAEEVVNTLDQDTYAALIRGRILLAQNKPAAALESFDRGIRNWPNNPGARYLAGVAAYELGDWKRAISELRETLRADQPGTAAARLLARIHFDRGEYQQSINYARRLAQAGPGGMTPDDYVMTIRALTKLGDYDAARLSAAELSKQPGQEANAVAELATIVTAAEGPEAALATISESGLDLVDHANQPALLVLVDGLMALGRNDEALARVNAAVAENGDDPVTHALQGNVLLRMGRSDEARQSFETALTLDPEHADSIGGLAILAGNARDFAKAVELFDRAAKISELSTPSFEYPAAQLTLQQGDKNGAIERLRVIVDEYPGHAPSRNDLAWLLAETGGDLDAALLLAREAQRLGPSADVLDTLGYVHIKRKEGPAAVAVLEQAHEQLPESPYIRMHLGMASAITGDSERARELLKSASETEGFAEADSAQRELAKLQP